MKILQQTKYQLSLGLMLLSVSITNAQAPNSKLKEIHQTYYGKWYKTLSFEQQTNFYKNDTLSRQQVWQEVAHFPSFFRIDFGDPKLGNTVIYRGDSAYNFKQAKLVRAAIAPNFLIYLLGGMYFDQFEVMQEKLSKAGFNVQQSDQSKWKGKDIVVIGAKASDSTSNQLWYDAKNKYLVRMIQKDKDSQMDVHFDKQENKDGIWHEMFVKVFINGKLAQEEIYSKFKINVPVNDELFNPHSFLIRSTY